MDAPYTLSTDVFGGRGIYVCKKHAVANRFLQTYIPLFVYSQRLGWRRREDAVVNRFDKT